MTDETTTNGTLKFQWHTTGQFDDIPRDHWTETWNGTTFKFSYAGDTITVRSTTDFSVTAPPGGSATQNRTSYSWSCTTPTSPQAAWTYTIYVGDHDPTFTIKRTTGTEVLE